MSEKNVPVQVFEECKDIIRKKSSDYENDSSQVRLADYFPNGCMTILDLMQIKILRMRSVMESVQNIEGFKPNFESLDDSAKDLINYSAFFVAYMRGEVDGQDSSRDWLNRKVTDRTIAQENQSEPLRLIPRI